MRVCVYQRLSDSRLRLRPAALRALAALLATSWSVPAQALDLGPLRMHGFASQAFILSSENDFFGNSNQGGSFGFTELGLNASSRPLPRLQLSAQILSRRAGAGDDGDVDLDYALVDYSFVSSETNLVGVRAGRIKNPLGFYNETRDVPFTRPSILLPQSIYFDRTRDLALSADGAQLYGEHRMRAGVIGFQIGVGRPMVSDDETELALLGNDLPGELEAKTSYIGQLTYKHHAGVRLALSAAQVNTDFDPAGASGDVTAGSDRFEPLIASAQYNAESWSLTGEYALRRVDTRGFDSPDRSITGESYYVQGIYRFSSDWRALLRYDVLFTDRDDRDGEEFAAATGNPAHSRFAKDLTVGVSWDITSSVLLRAEYHNVDGTAWLPLLDNPVVAATEENWDMFLLQGSLRF